MKSATFASSFLSITRMSNASQHTFHIPVLGLCFSIDSPLKVARYGISSVVSIIEDELIEHMRSYHCLQNGKVYIPISEKEHDYRAKRITAYLNMMQELVGEQIALLKAQPLKEGTELWKYFQLLPENAALKNKFNTFLQTIDAAIKKGLEEELSNAVAPGAIDVNIMAKVDNARYDKEGNRLPDEYSDALSALRGFAQSNLSSSVVFSAGYNPKLYAYAEQFADFFPDEAGVLKKKIILKVSDYRSALVQGKLLAKKGLWVSEFRIESGLNCGGHAFATEGLLMGPILEEFKNKRAELRQELFDLCNRSLAAKGVLQLPETAPQRIAAQGGIGTGEEQTFLLDYYQLDGTGWGSPFLLVPEATNVDDTTLSQLASASPNDYYLSNASPLGVPFNNFRRSSSEAQRKDRVERNRPGSPCYKKYLSSDTEFTDQPICTASRKYQHLKIKQLKESNLPEQVLQQKIEALEEKDCLCEGLTTSVRLKNEMYLPHQLSAVAICPGPNLAFFSGVFSLQQMVDHIYDRSEITNKLPRPHMFVNELKLYIDYFQKHMDTAQTKVLEKFRSNLLAGISYYKLLLSDAKEELARYEEMLQREVVLA
ncbi:MAG TPA: hypothetical protein PL009_01985 [Flavipsychrobacter sp.]|nr:hypothetical protein [Flavipsychrobacter sp.]